MATKAVQVDFLLSQVRNATGALLGGKVYFYEAGASESPGNLKTIWLDRNKSNSAANPYTLDANGTAQLYADGVYKVVIKNSSGSTIYTRDNLDFGSNTSPWVYAADYDSLSDAISDPDTSGKTLLISTVMTCGDITRPADVDIAFVQGGRIDVNTGKTFSWNDGIPAGEPSYQIHGGAGTVRGLSASQPVWFGGYDSAATQKAFDGLKSATGVVNGKLTSDLPLTIDAALTFDCGQTPYGSMTAEQKKSRFQFSASIQPGNSIGTSISLEDAFAPKIDLHVSGGGTGGIATENALKLADVRGGDIRIKGHTYGGTVFRYDAADGSLTELSDVSIHTISCGRAIYLKGNESGIGRFSTVWDVMPTSASLFEDVSDVSFDHYETTTPSSRTDPTLILDGGSTYHFKTLACGEGGLPIVKIDGVLRVAIDDLYVWGGSGGDRADTGIHVIDSYVTIGTVFAGNMDIAVKADTGNKLIIGSFQGLSNNTEIKLVKDVSASTSTEVDVAQFISELAYKEAVIIDSSVLGGQLVIGGGSAQGGNVGGTATYALSLLPGNNGFRYVLSNLYVSGSYTKSLHVKNPTNLSAINCNFTQGVTSTDVTGISNDGRSYMPTPAASPLAFDTVYTNTLSRPIRVTQPVDFVADSTHWASVKLTDTSGTVHDQIDRITSLSAGGATQRMVLQFTVPAGWSYELGRSGATKVTGVAATKVMVQ